MQQQLQIHQSKGISVHHKKCSYVPSRSCQELMWLKLTNFAQQCFAAIVPCRWKRPNHQIATHFAKIAVMSGIATLMVERTSFRLDYITTSSANLSTTCSTEQHKYCGPNSLNAWVMRRNEPYQLALSESVYENRWLSSKTPTTPYFRIQFSHSTFKFHERCCCCCFIDYIWYEIGNDYEIANKLFLLHRRGGNVFCLLASKFRVW